MTGWIHPGRLKLAGILCLLPFAAVIPRLLWLQLVQVDRLNQDAALQNMSRIWIPPQRGEIQDRNGVRLAFSVADTVSRSGKPAMRRLYPFGPSTAQVVGYTDSRGIGRAGIEKELEGPLKGHPGYATELRDGEGKKYVFSNRPGKSNTHGYDIVLTIDANLQDVAMSRLEETAKRLEAKWGSLVAVDPRTGEVLVMVAWPSYDPEHYNRANPAHVQNVAVSRPIEPGSTFKLIPAVTALREGLFDANTMIHCENGSYRIGRRTITDHEKFGLLPFHACFAHSSNIAFSKVGEACGEMLYDTARDFRFGSATGIRLPGESNGRVPKPPQEWSGLTSASLAMGYEVLATQLQMTMAYASIGNGGVLMRPYVLKSIRDASGDEVFVNRPEPRERVVEPPLCRQIKSFLREVVVDGTGKNAALGWTDVGGKTGTTRKVVNGSYSSGHHYASFVGMAPLDNPRLVMMVTLDEPKNTYGGAAAAPLFREILDAYRRIPGARLSPDYATVRAAAGKKDESPLERIWPSRVEADDSRGNPETAGGRRGVPEVRGMAMRAALQRLDRLGIEVEVVGSGIVARQEPATGAAIPKHMTLFCEPPRARRLDVVLATTGPGTTSRIP